MEISSLSSAWFLICGVAAGVFAGIFGIGGGAVLVPALVFLGLPISRAAGISLVALLLPVGALGAWEYYQSGRVDRTDISQALWVAAGLFAGTWLGAKFSEPFSGVLLKRGFAVFLAMIAVRLWFQAER
jgi:uncharacterized membrane protein YfcA